MFIYFLFFERIRCSSLLLSIQHSVLTAWLRVPLRQPCCVTVMIAGVYGNHLLAWQDASYTQTNIMFLFWVRSLSHPPRVRLFKSHLHWRFTSVTHCHSDVASYPYVNSIRARVCFVFDIWFRVWLFPIYGAYCIIQYKIFSLKWLGNTNIRYIQCVHRI